MCSQSVSGSSLLSGYDDENIRETSGRSQRDFEQIDAVLYDEDICKRSSIKEICEEWSSKPHFRVRGRLCSINQEQITTANVTTSILDQLTSNSKSSSFYTNEVDVSSRRT
jgi:Tfp pilus assembly pilus retraction ATPase PilT